LAILAPFLLIDLTFFGSNLLKIPDGAWAPLVVGVLVVILMWTWERGTRILARKSRQEAIPLPDLIKMIEVKPPQRAPGTAIFLTSDPEAAPVALLHNLKHNAVLHERNIIATVRTIDRPRVPEDERISIETLSDDFYRIVIRYGFMESPNLPKALGRCRQLGVKFNIMSTSFFLGRRTIVPRPGHSMPMWQDWLYLFLMRNAANPTDFFKIPPGRVVEMGTQVTL
jgi:KUP system potassium uptake protein